MGVQDDTTPQSTPYQQLGNDSSSQTPSFQQPQLLPQYDHSQFQQAPPQEYQPQGAIINSQQYEQQQLSQQPLMNNQGGQPSIPQSSQQQSAQLQQIDSKIKSSLSCVTCLAWYLLITGILALLYNSYSAIQLANATFITEDQFIILISMDALIILENFLVVMSAVKMFKVIKNKKASEINIARIILIVAIFVDVITIFLGFLPGIFDVVMLSLVVIFISNLEQSLKTKERILGQNAIHQA